jgi:hypothetical protein
MRVTFQSDSTVQVFRLGKTTNKKIADKNEKIVQTYTFSVDQFNYIKMNMLNGTKPKFNDFFSLDAKNCFDCPFSSNANAGIGKCYTHKVMQYSGFVSMLKSIVIEFDNIKNVPTFNSDIEAKLIKMSRDRYVRFGTYGEPTMHPIDIVASMANVSKSWTGYTHQYVRNKTYNKYFMASTHNELQAKTANDKFEFRSFIAVKDNNKGLGVICPASKEANFKSNCSACGLCSGSLGKGKKDVVILQH